MLLVLLGIELELYLWHHFGQECVEFVAMTLYILINIGVWTKHPKSMDVMHA